MHAARRSRPSLLLLLLGLAACANDPESFGAKQEWSVLQVIEYDQRANLLKGPSIRAFGEYEVLGLPGDHGRNVWIMLRPTNTPYYKQMPAYAGYSVPRAFLESLQNERRMSLTVEAVLKSHATPPGR
jgi:hypothetical protein